MRSTKLTYVSRIRNQFSTRTFQGRIMHSFKSFFGSAGAIVLTITFQSLLCYATLARSRPNPKGIQESQVLEQLEAGSPLEKRQITTSGGFSFNTINTCLVVSLSYFSDLDLLFYFLHATLSVTCTISQIYPPLSSLSFVSKLITVAHFN